MAALLDLHQAASIHPRQLRHGVLCLEVAFSRTRCTKKQLKQSLANAIAVPLSHLMQYFSLFRSRLVQLQTAFEFLCNSPLHIRQIL